VPPPDSLAVFLERVIVEINFSLTRYLPKPPDCPAIVSEAMRYSVFAGGKRLRPILTLASADAVARVGPADRVRPPREAAFPAACAVELIHTYSLIHDDLPAMDNDTLRRGRPTLHVVYGDGIAVLAGDGLQAEAFALLAREPAGDEPDLVTRKLRVIEVVAAAAGATGMVGGQAIDLQVAGQAPGGLQGAPPLDAEGLRDMHSRKTGAMIRASAVVGAIMAGASDDLIAAVDRYAAEIGLAFQIVDDVLDVEGSAGELGKTAGKDAAESKPTYAALYGVSRSRELAAECAVRAHQTLAAAGLTGGHLGAIADWIVTRKN